MDTPTVNATEDQIKDFMDSILWKDIVAELEAWKRGFNDEMLALTEDAVETNPSTASVLLHMGDLHGRQKAVDYMIGLLDVFLSILEAKKK